MADVDECLLLSLPSELLALLVLAVPAAGDVGRLAATCRALHRVASLPGVRAVWLVRRYGAAAWRTGLARHRRMLAGWTRVPTADDALPELENDVLGDFAPAPFALPGPEGPVPTVPLALCALGLPPPRHLLQEFFAWFTNNRNGFRAWDRETGDAFTDAEPDTWGNVVADNWDNETVVFGEEAALLGPPSPPLVPSESSSSSSSDLGPASTSSPALALPPPPTLSFLPLPPRQSVPPAPKVHDQVLLTQLLEAASAAYGPSELALLGRDELLLERLLRLDAVLPLVPDEEDPEGNLLSMEQLEGEEGARRWIARRKEHFDRVKEQVLSVIFT